MSKVSRMMTSPRDYNSYDGMNAAINRLVSKMKIIYITGCLGFIGSYFTRKALERGWKVYGIDKMTYAANKDILDEFNRFDNFTFQKVDIKDLDHLYDCDYIVNFAAESHVDNSIQRSDEFVNSNILGVKNLLDLVRYKSQNAGDRPVFFQISTDEVYGDLDHGKHTETDLLMPSNPYSASKASADMLILAWARTYGIKYVILRPTNNYGIGQYPEKLIPISVKSLMRGRKINLHNKGEPIRNWLHADDTAEAVALLIKRKVKNEIFNVAGGFEQSNAVTVKKILKSYFGKDILLDCHTNLSISRDGQDMRYALDDSKLKSLGWEPKKVFDEEITSIVKYYKTNFIW